MVSIGGANKIRENINNLPEQYQTDKYSPPLEEEKKQIKREIK